jgi:hypothetical protein
LTDFVGTLQQAANAVTGLAIVTRDVASKPYYQELAKDLNTLAGFGDPLFISPMGTTNTIAMFTGPSSLGNSIVTQAGTTITVAGTVIASNIMFIGPYSATLGASVAGLNIANNGRADIRFYDSTAPTDQKCWDMSMDGNGGPNNTFNFVLRSDAFASGSRIWAITRSTTSVSAFILIPDSGTLTVGGASTFDSSIIAPVGPIVVGTVPGGTLVGVILSSSATTLAFTAIATAFTVWNGTNQTYYSDRGCGTKTNDLFSLASNNTNRWQVAAGGDFIPFADTTYNLGSSSDRIIAGYFSTDIVVGTVPGGTIGGVLLSSSATTLAFTAIATAFTVWNGTNQTYYSDRGCGTKTNDLFSLATDNLNRWQVAAVGDFLPFTDATYSVGSSANRFLNAFGSGYLIIGTVPGGTPGGIILSTSATTLADNPVATEFTVWDGTHQTHYAGRGCGTRTNDLFALATNDLNRWQVVAGGDFIPFADATYNLGSSSERIIAGYFSTDLVVGTVPGGTIGGVLLSSSATTLAFTAIATAFTVWNGTNQTYYSDRGCGTKTNDLFALATSNTNRWQVDASGNFIAFTDNAYNIGASGANRPANAYVYGKVWLGSGSSATFPHSLAVGTAEAGLDLDSTSNSGHCWQIAATSAGSFGVNTYEGWLVIYDVTTSGQRQWFDTIGNVIFGGAVPSSGMTNGNVLLLSTSTTGLTITATSRSFVIWDGTHQTFYANRGAGTASNDIFALATNNTNRWQVTAAGSFGPLISSFSTTQTTGFLYLPYSSGAPTGVPESITDAAAMEWDDTNKQLCIYSPSSGAWKKVTLV